MSGNLGRLGALGLGLLLALALALRVYGLGHQSVWIDEAYSLRLAEEAPAQIVAETARDNHPPLYYLMLSSWNRLGFSGEVWARLLSALLGTALVGVFFAFAREVADPQTAWVATLLLAFSPQAIWHSQDARMYCLWLLAVYLGVLLFVRYLRNGTGAALGFSALALSAGIYTHLYTIFILPALLLHLVIERGELPPSRLRRAAVAILAVAASAVPWMWLVMGSALKEAGYYKPIGAFSIPYVFYAFSVGYSLGPPVGELHHAWRGLAIEPRHWIAITASAVVFGGTFLAGLLAARRRLGRSAPLVVLLLVVPLLLPVIVTLVSRIDFNARYALTAFPAYLLLLGVGLAVLRPAAVRVTAGCGVAILIVASLAHYYTDPAYAKEDSRSAFRLVRERLQEGDCVLVLGVGAAYRYYEGVPGRSTWLDFRSVEKASRAEAALETWSRDCRRLWFVSGREWEEDPLDLALPALEKHFEQVERWQLSGIRVVELQPRLRRVQGAAGASVE